MSACTDCGNPLERKPWAMAALARKDESYGARHGIKSVNALRVDDFSLFEDIEVRHHDCVQLVRPWAKIQSHHANLLDERRFLIVSFNLLRIDILSITEDDYFFFAAG